MQYLLLSYSAVIQSALRNRPLIPMCIYLNAVDIFSFTEDVGTSITCVWSNFTLFQIL
jgi:hypothetical protein